MSKPPPYSPVTIANDLVFVAGQVGKDFEAGTVSDSLEDQTHQALKNLRDHLEKNSSSMTNVVKTTIFLTDMGDYGVVNDIYASYFSEPYPSRSCVAVKELPRIADVDLVVEIEAIATLG